MYTIATFVTVQSGQPHFSVEAVETKYLNSYLEGVKKSAKSLGYNGPEEKNGQLMRSQTVDMGSETTTIYMALKLSDIKDIIGKTEYEKIEG